MIQNLERIENCIHLVRGQRVMLDFDLARIYGVTTTRLNQQIKRNQDRFPQDFCFRITPNELPNLMLQFARSSSSHGGRRKPSYAFTGHGAIMAASVLNSPVAIQASVQVVRAFVELRGLLAANRDLARKSAELEQRYDAQFKVVFDAIRQLTRPPQPTRGVIGFHVKERRARYRAHK